jgi:hypothetical protein
VLNRVASIDSAITGGRGAAVVAAAVDIVHQGGAYSENVLARFNEQRHPVDTRETLAASSVSHLHREAAAWQPPVVRPLSLKSDRLELGVSSPPRGAVVSDSADSGAAVRELYRHGVTVQHNTRDPSAWTATPAVLGLRAATPRRSSVGSATTAHAVAPSLPTGTPSTPTGYSSSLGRRNSEPLALPVPLTSPGRAKPRMSHAYKFGLPA